MTQRNKVISTDISVDGIKAEVFDSIKYEGMGLDALL